MRFPHLTPVRTLAAIALLAGAAAMPLVPAHADGAAAQMDPAMMSDLVMERDIMRALFREPELAGSNISVTCLDGVVTLTGFVKDELQVRQAERLARQVAGVDEINNYLRT